MLTGWRYRIISILGVVVLASIAVTIANHPLSQYLFTTYIPLFNRLDVIVLTGESLSWTLLLSVIAVGGCLLPLYKPRPRRVLDSIFVAQKRVVVAGLALATLGFFNWSHRVPRATLVMIAGILLITIPAWFVFIQRPPGETGRTLIVGDDPAQIERVAPAVSTPVIGYLCSMTLSYRDGDSDAIADGGVTIQRDASAVTDRRIEEENQIDMLPRLGGLSRMEDVLLEHDIDTVVLAFRRADRAEFFGALDACHEHGVHAKVHREYADSVLVSDGDVGELIDVDLEPWDPLDHLLKRAFDIMFATVGLVVFAPLMLLIPAAIKLDSRGPILYSQNRTTGFGETFSVFKFRSMVPEGEDAIPTKDDENNRITRLGRVLRQTHMDELPQLWSIFVGDMSVVGPRAVWTEEEMLLEENTPSWRKRWFVKPGLTGLAQIRRAGSENPETKLRFDLEYIRRQSFSLDVYIVIVQLWLVVIDTIRTFVPNR